MLYFNLSFQTVKSLWRKANSHGSSLSMSDVVVFLATHPNHLPRIQIEMEMECIKQSLSLLFELQMTVTSIEHHQEPVQVFDLCLRNIRIFI
jgi:hypothetical protein